MFKEYNAKAYELSKQALILDVGKIYVSVHDGVDRECENVISIFLIFFRTIMFFMWVCPSFEGVIGLFGLFLCSNTLLALVQLSGG